MEQTLRAAHAIPVDAVSLRSAEHRIASLNVQLPLRAQQPMRITSGPAWIEIAAAGAADVAMTIEEGKAVYHDAAEATDVVYVATATGLEDLRILRDPRANATTHYAVRTSERLAIENGKLVARDAHGAEVLSADPPIAIDAHGEKRAATFTLAGGDLVVALDDHGLAHPIVVDPFWSATKPLATKRSDATLTLLASGKALVAGGGANGSSEGTSTAEIYDPTTNAWTAAASMNEERRLHAATLLASGKVLVAGGEIDTITSKTGETYDPATDKWAAAGTMAIRRRNFTLSTLPSGKAFAVGGYDDALTPLATTELYDPATNAWSAGPPLPKPRGGHIAVTLPGGKIAIVGGYEGDDTAVSPLAKTAYLYDAATGWKASGPYVQARDFATATAVAGKIVYVGGDNEDGTKSYSSAEAYDPATDTWTAVAGLAKDRNSHFAAALSGGRLLIAGGTGGEELDDFATTEIFDLAKNAWSPAPPLAIARSFPSAVVLAGDRVLALGGTSNTSSGSAEVFTAVTPTCSSDATCSTGHCVDGFCCDNACTGQCEACNVAGSEGACTAVKGAPAGGRAACADGSDSEICKRQVCDGTVRTACSLPTGSCSVKGCSEGVESHAANCKAGACSDIPVNCGAFTCGTDACTKSCADDSTCSKGYRCDGSSCVPSRAKCDDASNSSIATDGSGATTSCREYSCNAASGECRKSCTGSEDCSPGNVCDGSNKCVGSAATTDDSGGCNYGQRSAGLSFAALLLLATLMARSQRRREPGSTKE